jgi:hypothetical protein
LTNLFLHKFYAASVSVALDGSMLVESTQDRILTWGITFFLIATLSLISFLVLSKSLIRKASIAIFILSLSIPLFIIPSSSEEFIHVNRDQITIHTGSWQTPSTTVVALANLQRISRDSSNFRISNFIGDAYVTWHFERQDGSVQNLVLNDFFSAHSMTIAHYIRDRGYRVDWL